MMFNILKKGYGVLVVCPIYPTHNKSIIITSTLQVLRCSTRFGPLVNQIEMIKLLNASS